ncbi:MAG: ABC transporter permease, partial [Chloroflexi bacterium]|nr:ABC transporter permease [Chloroflexota bacterium]
KPWILPAFCLSIGTSAFLARLTRSTVLEVMRQDYVRTAWAKGLPERTVIVRHALKNAFIPVITILGTQVGFLIGGVAIVETIFNLPGMGRVTVNAIDHRDLPLIQTAVFIFAGVLILINLLVDVSYAWFDPRIRYG